MKDEFNQKLEDAKTLIGLSLLELGDRLAIIKQLASSMTALLTRTISIQYFS